MGMDGDKKPLGFVFVGCGGTFWASSPMMASLVKRYEPDTVVFVDGDMIEEKNLERQWVNEVVVGASKSGLGLNAVCPFHMNAGTYASMLERETEIPEVDGHDVIVISSVDSNAARLVAKDWCRRRRGYAAHVVTGCDVNHGQVYYGAWYNQDAVYDWETMHPDVALARQAREAPCGQNIFSNAMTGVLIAPALQDVMLMRNDPRGIKMAREFYWKNTEAGPKVWTVDVDVESLEERGNR